MEINPNDIKYNLNVPSNSQFKIIYNNNNPEIKKIIDIYKLPIDINKCNNQFVSIKKTPVYPPY